VNWKESDMKDDKVVALREEPEADELVECDLLLGHDGPHPWQIEREEERRARAVRAAENEGPDKREERRWEKRGESRFGAR
jgi:hypothetical protein